VGGFKSKNLIVENFFGLKGQEQGKTDRKGHKKSPDKFGALVIHLNTLILF
jgi:hypothetical protein